MQLSRTRTQIAHTPRDATTAKGCKQLNVLVLPVCLIACRVLKTKGSQEKNNTENCSKPLVPVLKTRQAERCCIGAGAGSDGDVDSDVSVNIFV